MSPGTLEVHKTLQRQLHILDLRSGQTLPTLAQWHALLDRVSATYEADDADRVTMQRERDELRSIFETAPLGIFKLSPDGKILDANPVAARMLERAPADLPGREFASLFSGRAEATPMGEDAGSAVVTERRHETGGGEIRFLRTTETWVRDGAGVVRFGTVVMEDVTATKHLEGSLRHAQKLESVGRLASGIAHELNTPIQFINDNVHFLETAFISTTALVASLTATIARGADWLIPRCREAEEAADWHYLGIEAPKAIAETIDGLQRVAKIVQSMKNFAHNDHGVQAPADLNGVLESTLTVAGHELRGVAVVTRDFGELPPIMCCHGDLGQVFLNLIVNAAHAIADVVAKTKQIGGITIVTRLESDYVRVSITDTGGGIPESAKPHLFEPFFTTKEVGRGSGQGLALARNIVVQRHKGTLTYDTVLGVGTTFHMRLPVAGVGGAEAETP